MSRFADALKRARTGSITGPGPEDDRPGDAIRFFTPGQPAVVPPWDIEGDSPRPSAPDLPRAWSERRGSPRLAELDRHAPARLHVSPPHVAEKLVTSPAIAVMAREQYNKLAAAIHHLHLERSVKVVMITSAVPSEGKTLTAANLALTLSESYERRVLLIDADLRHPSVHGVFGASNNPGLADSLTGSGPLPLVHVSAGLSLLTAGSTGGDPMKTLTSDRMRSVVEEARASFDWVILDTAPIGLLPDAGLLASMTDGTLLVARAGQTGYDVIQRAVDAVGTDRILGIVLNGVAESEVPQSYYGDYYYGAPAR
jgi:capsular exopolysaccharide synthesis family protein